MIVKERQINNKNNKKQSTRRATTFEFLGSKLAEDGKIDTEIRKRKMK